MVTIVMIYDNQGLLGGRDGDGDHGDDNDQTLESNENNDIQGLPGDCRVVVFNAQRYLPMIIKIN